MSGATTVDKFRLNSLEQSYLFYAVQFVSNSSWKALSHKIDDRFGGKTSYN